LLTDTVPPLGSVLTVTSDSKVLNFVPSFPVRSKVYPSKLKVPVLTAGIDADEAAGTLIILVNLVPLGFEVLKIV
jgi:hypothetical protein